MNITCVQKTNTISHELNWVLTIGNPKSDRRNITIWQDGTMNYLGLTIPHVDGIQIVGDSSKCTIVLLVGTIDDPYLMCFELTNLTDENIEDIKRFIEFSKLNVEGIYGG